MHFDNARPGGFVGEHVPGAADFWRWDVTQSKMLNGDAGGTWAPTATIYLGSQSGVDGGTLSTGSSILQGGVTTQYSGRILITSAANDFPVLGPTRTRSIYVPIYQAGVHVELGDRMREEYYLTREMPTFPGGRFGVRVRNTLTDLYADVPGRCVHAGAILQTATVQFAVTQSGVAPRTANGHQIQLRVNGFDTNDAYQAFVPSGVSLGGSAYVNWTAIAAHGLGDIVIGSTPAHDNGYYFKATVGGTTGGSEPVWPNTVGSTVTDGSVTWTCEGRSGNYPTGGPDGHTPATSDTYYAAAQLQTLALDTMGSSGNVINSTTTRYQLQLRNVAPELLVTGVLLTFSGISSMQFE